MVTELIQELGGAAAVAKGTPYSAEAIRMWAYRGKIPRGAWPDLVEAYPETVSYERLKEIEQAPKAPFADVIIAGAK